tara:strand:+ start:1786 stop:2256 length:471 start_codon:yes stop_codon:yes gene_type:complete
MPIFDPDGQCPLIKKKCMKHRCIWYNMLQGNNPQTGSPVQEWGCSIAWLPLLLVENNGKQIQTTAAVESFRNEMVKANMVTLAMVDQKNKEQQNPKLNNVGSMWDKIGNAQEDIDKGEEPEEDIQLLRGKKIDKKKKGTKKVVKKNGNNNKQRNRK